MKLFLTIWAGFLFSTGLLAQPTKRQIDSGRWYIEFSMPDTANRGFLSRHDSLNSITVVYKDKLPYIIFLNFPKSVPGRERMHFDLAFAGDRYFFLNKYGPVRQFSVKQIDQIKWPEHGTTDVILTSTTFDGDSVFCRGEFTLPNVKKFNADWNVGAPAKFRGDIKSLEEKIAREFRKVSDGMVIDSLLVFEGTVTTQFKLEGLSLVVGRKSAFSDLAARVLLEPKAGWYPATNSIRPVEGRSRIFVKLKPDGAVIIETPRILRTMSGS